MKARSVLLAALAVFAAAMPASAEIISVLDVRAAETWVDSITLLSTAPVIVPTPDFGGEPGVVDTAALGDHPWPEGAVLFWRFADEPMPPHRITPVVSGEWYELPPPGDDEMPLIKFVNLGAVAEPETRPVLARITAWPNPFSARTRLSVRLARPGRALVEVYDATGRPVRVLADAELQPGRHRWVWDGADDAGNRLAPGIYLARLATGDESCIRKLVLTD